MKTHVLSVALSFAFISAFSGELKVTPRVEERTELLSIVFRLAGAPEYVNNNIPSYAEEMDTFFKPYKEHAAVKFAVKMGKTRGVNFDAVMSLAVNIEITDSVRLRAGILPQSIDKRWGQENVLQFTGLLNQFYAATKFKDFYTSHRALYQTAEERFSAYLDKVDFGWFEKFYGISPKGNFHLILSIPNGGGNYGIKVKLSGGREELYAVMGSCMADLAGAPSYQANVVSTVVHEYNHSFCNPLIDASYPAMKNASEKIFRTVKSNMESQAYAQARTMDYEILVRACVIRYSQRNGADENSLKNGITEEMANGFLWIDRLVNLLSAYENDRKKYPALQDFMPRIVGLVNSLSARQLEVDFKASCPKIISISIISNSKKVDPDTPEITATFDKPMSTAYKGLAYGKKGKEYFPEFAKGKKSTWNRETHTQWSFPVALKPGCTYSLCIPSRFFRGENNYPLDRSYYLDFKTAVK
ncbi:MAG: DUF4932 domain-containing protein [Bacteroidales bacterium]|nr:DUF4932 domain-containing protein [Bacteroidales bacterium]